MRRTKEEAEKTRKKILDTAAGLFAQKGVQSTALEEIAKTAGVTRGAIYWHFKNKAEIFEALHEGLYQPFADMIAQDMDKNHPDPLAQMQELCTRLLTDLEDDAQKREALTLFLIKCDYTGEMASYKERHMAQKKQSLKMLSRYLERARQKGDLPQDADAQTLTFALSCYMKGILVEYLAEPENFDIKNVAPKLMNVFFKNWNNN